jgi:hypothetical protein
MLITVIERVMNGAIMATPRNLNNQELQAFGDKITDEFPEQCVPNKDHLCQYVSTQEGRIVYAYNLGQIDEEEAIVRAQKCKQSIAKYCLSGIGGDGARTVCNFNTPDPREQ